VNTAYPVQGESEDGNPVGPGVNGFLLGTDSTGRDLLVRVLYGARISLFVGIVTTLIATVLGVAVGLIAGYFGGIIDTVLARFTDAVLAFPYIVLALALAAVFGPSLTIIVVMITFFSWAGIARIVRGQTLSIKEKEYIEAARSLGAGPFRIMFFDILPNLLAPILVIGTLYIPNAVVFEATLSYLGLGVQAPTPSWGNMLADAQNFYQVAWWYLVFPAVSPLSASLLPFLTARPVSRRRIRLAAISRSVRGSIASLIPSPSRLKASVVMSSASAGNTTYHQDVW
jgi:ABC-type dipeptide/oligopeptide/nickel transport system permease subunit